MIILFLLSFFPILLVEENEHAPVQNESVSILIDFVTVTNGKVLDCTIVIRAQGYDDFLVAHIGRKSERPLCFIPSNQLLPGGLFFTIVNAQ